MSDRIRIEELEGQMRKAMNRISELEQTVRDLRSDHLSAIAGHDVLLERLVRHTNCRPPPGRKFVFPRR
jgi:hypothetical protein